MLRILSTSALFRQSGSVARPLSEALYTLSEGTTDDLARMLQYIRVYLEAYASQSLVVLMFPHQVQQSSTAYLTTAP